MWYSEVSMDTSMNAPVDEADVQSGALQDEALAHSMERTNPMKKKPQVFVIGAAVAVLLGLATGYVGASLSKTTVTPLEMSTRTDSSGAAVSAMPGIKVGQTFGSKDASAFKDSAEGVLLPGGIGSEGSHHLVRPGGASQSVYLTSSVMDLKMFENAKVRVFGETFKAQKAGWLMDVGRVEVEELNAPLPDWVVQQQQKTNSAAGCE